MITVTLQQIKDAGPCADGWIEVLKANGGKNADMNKPFPLVSILDSNDLDDTLWVISKVPNLAEHEKIWREFACFCALQNIVKIKPYCSFDEYELIVNYLTTQDKGLRAAAESAARDAARTAAWSAAEYAAWSSARSAAWSASYAAEHAAEFAAWSAARYAAYDGAYAASSDVCDGAYAASSDVCDGAYDSSYAAALAQTKKLRELLTGYAI